MNIFKLEFKLLTRSVFTWSLSLVLMLAFFLSIYSSFAESAEVLSAAMEKFPPELLMAFGMSEIDLSSVLGFFGMGFLFVQICLAIQAANYGFSLVSVEEREMTADFLLVKPVSRPRILSHKLLAALSALAITNLAVWISSLVFIDLFRGGRAFEMKALLLLLGSMAVFQVFFLSLGVLISLLVKRVRSVTPYSMGLAFGLYVLNAFGGMLGEDSLEVLTPFKHFEPNYIITHVAYDPLALISVAVILAAVPASYLLYIRRDIHSVA